MRITTVILFMACLQASALEGNPQITLSAKGTSLENIFKSIRKQTGYKFFYNYDWMQNTKPVTINVKNATLEHVLTLCMKDQPLTYAIVDNTVILKQKEAPPGLASPSNIDDPPITIKGKVTNEKGEAADGVTVTIKGSKRAVSTNASGDFSFEGVDGGAVLVFSGVGFETYEVRVGGRREINVAMRMRMKEMEEVMVSTGYQEVDKTRATGSFVKIDNELLNRSVSTNIMDRIKDVTSGLNYNPKTITSSRGAISIRGISTINADFKPLVVVDGFIYDEGNSFGLINNLNPNDIESISVLKDAAAASIWGARSGNGVIVITTKKGKFNQKTNVQFVSNVTVTRKPDMFYNPVIPTEDYIEYEVFNFKRGVYNSLINNTTTRPVISDLIEMLAKRRAGVISAEDSLELISAYKDNDIRNDINKYLLQKGLNQQYALNVSGGSDRHSYYASLGFDDNTENAVRNKYKRFTMKLDNTFRPVKGMEVNIYAAYVQSKEYNNGLDYTSLLPNGNSPSSKTTIYTKLANERGEGVRIPQTYRMAYIDTAIFPALRDWHYIPLNELWGNNNARNSYDIRLGGSIRYMVIKGLHAEIRYQYQRIMTNSNNYFSENSFFTRDFINQYMFRNMGVDTFPVPIGGILNNTDTRMSNWTFRPQLTFNRKWMRHELNVLIGMETREMDIDVSTSRRYGYDIESKNFSTTINFERSYVIRPSAGTSRKVPNTDSENGEINRFVSYFMNVAYSYNQKYTISLSGRKDGANLFGVKANDRITPFWSAGVSWDISKESFYSSRFFPYLKIRSTFGYNGNTKLNATTYATANYGFVDFITSAIYGQVITPPNPELRWEKVRIVNIGLDFESRNQILSGSLEYYIKKGINLIGQITTESTTGFETYTGNTASIKGNGIDIILNSLNVNTKQIKWATNFLFSYNTDKVVSYSLSTTAAQLLAGNPSLNKPLFSLYSYKWGGLNPINGEPLAYAKNMIVPYNVALSGNNTKPEDLIYSGPSSPTFFGSFRNTFSWKQLSLSLNVTYKMGYYFRRPSINYTNLQNNWGGHIDYIYRWKEPGDQVSTNVLSWIATSNSNRESFYANSEILVQKGDHIRLQDIRVSFYVNKMRNLIFSKQAELFVYMNNIGIIWRANKFNIDPEYGANSIPVARSISVGLNINL